jgi:hypothetical protein
MNLRCFYCQTPFTVGRPEMLAALQRMETENLNHYDAHCPRCRRANSVSRERMEMFFPNWHEVAEEQAANPPERMSAAPSAESSDEEPVPTAPATSMKEPAMEPESMQSSANKHTMKRAGSANKTMPAAAKKMTAKTAKKPAGATTKPAAKKKTAAKTKKK